MRCKRPRRSDSASSSDPLLRHPLLLLASVVVVTHRRCCVPALVPCRSRADWRRPLPSNRLLRSRYRTSKQPEPSNTVLLLLCGCRVRSVMVCSLCWQQLLLLTAATATQANAFVSGYCRWPPRSQKKMTLRRSSMRWGSWMGSAHTSTRPQAVCYCNSRWCSSLLDREPLLCGITNSHSPLPANHCHLSFCLLITTVVNRHGAGA